jgi:predicted glycosyltransferase
MDTVRRTVIVDAQKLVSELMNLSHCNNAGPHHGRSVNGSSESEHIPSRPHRVVLYSHDTMGLGHMRRNLSIARALAGSGAGTNVLMITGANIATGFAMPPGVDCLTLPGLYKEADGSYRSRSLGLSLDELITLRAMTIRGALEAYQPDVLIVDNVPRGVNGELGGVLEQLRHQGRTQCILGLRDILDDPDTIRKEWKQRANEDCIQQYYDAVWVYGDQSFYDSGAEYGFSDPVTRKFSYTGYLNRCLDPDTVANTHQNLANDAVDLPRGETLLCLAGGGQDGAALVQLVCEASLPTDMNLVILTGPFMPAAMRQKLHSQAAANPRLRVEEFHPEPTHLIARADRIISMGGYNTISEILSLGKKALVVPRVSPRREQLIRAERLEQLGLLDVLHPCKVTPESVSDWLRRDMELPPCANELIDFSGLKRIPSLLNTVINNYRHTACGVPA